MAPPNMAPALLLLWTAALFGSSEAWRACDVLRDFGAQGDGRQVDTGPIRAALSKCDEVLLPAGHSFLTGPLNLTSNQVLRVDGTLLASTEAADYPLVAPELGYGWSNDQNCFPPDASPHKIVVGKLRHSPVLGAFRTKNVTITGSGVIDGQGAVWWQNCTRCHYPPHNDSSFCEVASRPKLIEAQFADGFRVLGASVGAPLTLQNSPFWTVTPSYSQNIHVRDLVILAPINRIGNTDGVNLDSCRKGLVENLVVRNSDDGVCVKSGLNGFGLNLAIPTEDVLVRNITCPKGGRGGFCVGSEMSGGVRNVTFRDSVLHGERGISIKPSVGRGGYIQGLTFENITGARIGFNMGRDGVPLMPGNHYVPLVSDLAFIGVASARGNAFGACKLANRSRCFNLTVDGRPTRWAEVLPPQRFGCKRTAKTMFDGEIALPWPVCVPLDAPVNLRPDYPNWGPLAGSYDSLQACRAACTSVEAADSLLV